MYVPYWFLKDLALIDSKYFADYNARKKIFEIRKWKTAYPRPRTIKLDSKLVCKIRYNQLDNRVLNDLREGLYNARHAKELLQKIDESNARLIEQAKMEDDYIARYMAKKIYSYYREPIVIGGLKTTTDRRWKY